jgi:hypothetical protein
MKFNTYSDPGHGWARVPRRLLELYGIADKITPYSYQRGDYVFLEEDCDLSTFLEAAKSRGVTVEFKHNSANKTSKIRSYDQYRPSVAPASVPAPAVVAAPAAAGARISLDDIKSFILRGDPNPDELESITSVLMFARKELNRKNTGSMTIGTSVKFKNPNTGIVHSGVVKKVNRKFIIVNTGTAVTGFSQEWRVPANLLSFA